MNLLQRVVLFVWTAALVLNVYVYNYPVLRDCAFPTKSAGDGRLGSRWGRLLHALGGGHVVAPEETAEFRLLAFADPQLEGDTSIWHASPDAPWHAAELRRRIHDATTLMDYVDAVWAASKSALLDALPSQLAAWRKQLDLIGNDYYLAHVYRAMHRHARPTHVAVMGDLLGSQWISDPEFDRRATRFWQRVFRGGIRVDDSITVKRADEVLGEDGAANAEHWRRRIINVAGNHDVGYAGDLTEDRMERFERAFGRANWEMWLHSPKTVDISGGDEAKEENNVRPRLRLVMLNSMNLDTPAKSEALQAETYEFINRIITTSAPVEDPGVGTVLLTHIPLHKQDGICVDGPFFDFAFDETTNGVREQNHLSYDAGLGILQGILGMSPDTSVPGAGMGRAGIILNGHDHEGCDVYHFVPPEGQRDLEKPWNATRWANAKAVMGEAVPGVREVTMRSMMGEFGGYSYMVSAWFDVPSKKWRFEVDRCGAGVQHWWWAAHIFGGIAVLSLGILLLAESKLYNKVVIERPQKRPQAKKSA